MRAIGLVWEGDSALGIALYCAFLTDAEPDPVKRFEQSLLIASVAADLTTTFGTRAAA
jgi:hypothetical protein